MNKPWRSIFIGLGVVVLAAVVFSVVLVRSGFQKQTVPAQAEEDEYVVGANVRVTDLDGTPLEGMIPIVTSTPNAFTRPDDRGEPTRHDGTGFVIFDHRQTVFVRAWDPNLEYFATNFYEVPFSQGGSATERMDIVMARAAALTGVLTDPAGAPVSKTQIDFMLEHPTEGPWWPARTITDASGAFVVPNVPPGEYAITLTCPGGSARLERVALRPGGAQNLGSVQLDPS